MTDVPPWWMTGVIYQIYPRSFQDTTDSGIGDLPGITRRLDYLVGTLGIDAIWISPFYPSPMADFGYDVSDYTDVHPLFGTLADFDELVAEAHARELRVIIDWVPNHSSDQHHWFQAARSSRDDPKRDWYLWHDPDPDGSPPNNWLAAFGGSAWEWDEATGQYYLHSFLKEQPDLNWRNPQLRAAMFDTIRFWLDRGADGFRVDVAHFVMKDPEFRDNPTAPGSDPCPALAPPTKPRIMCTTRRIQTVTTSTGRCGRFSTRMTGIASPSARFRWTTSTDGRRTTATSSTSCICRSTSPC